MLEYILIWLHRKLTVLHPGDKVTDNSHTLNWKGIQLPKFCVSLGSQIIGKGSQCNTRYVPLSEFVID